MYQHNCRYRASRQTCRLVATRVCGSDKRCRLLRCHAAAQEVHAADVQSALRFDVRVAQSPAELRAAGYLRASCFYTYPEDRSEYAMRMHRRMKGDAEWNSATAKVQGTEPDYTHLKVFCLIATAADDAQHPIIQQLYSDMDASTKLPAGDCQAGTASVVVGSLDLNQGAVLPAEEMVGRQPEVDVATRRAYLSNVCVAAAARRQVRLSFRVRVLSITCV
eukprot:jgi/Chrzof1/8449/Cz03g11010.t1